MTEESIQGEQNTRQSLIEKDLQEIRDFVELRMTQFREKYKCGKSDIFIIGGGKSIFEIGFCINWDLPTEYEPVIKIIYEND